MSVTHPAHSIPARPLSGSRIKALVLIAPAWDMTELIWHNLPSGARKDIEETGVFLRPSSYGDGPGASARPTHASRTAAFRGLGVVALSHAPR